MKSYYLGTRYNPQLPKPYIVKYGQLTKKDSKKKENCSYGSMSLEGFESENEYNEKIKYYEDKGYIVR